MKSITFLWIIGFLVISALCRPVSGMKVCKKIKPLTGTVLVEVNGELEEDAEVEVFLAKASTSSKSKAINVGRGTYRIALPQVLEGAHYLEVTARVPSRHHGHRSLSQTLLVDISKGSDVEIPINISTN